jgi:DNA polymerase-3 subunit delta'
MPIVSLYGHEALRERLLPPIRSGALPQSMLLFGPPGVGKQRLALWMGQALLCQAAVVPCGICQHCRYALELVHPDLAWVFPRPRPKESDADLDDIKSDLAVAAKERLDRKGLYAAPAGSDGIFISTIRYLVRQAAFTPALAARKVFVIGDADRMVPQEGSEYAANALLKLLEEPPEDTWIILTTSALGALLPTIRSRVVSLRVPRLKDEEVRAFVTDAAVAAVLDGLDLPRSTTERVSLAGGAPGTLLSSRMRDGALRDARRLLQAVLAGERAELLRLALVQGHSGARGGFSDLLDALTVTLHERMRQETFGANDRQAAAASRAIDLVEDAKLLADGNVSPQLITAKLLRDLASTLA